MIRLNEKNLLEVDRLSVAFKTERGYLKAVDDMRFCVNTQEVLGVVGESGCGKSVTMQAIMRLFDERSGLTQYKGQVKMHGCNLMDIPFQAYDKIRGKQIAMVFQDALSALDPLFPIGQQLDEALRIHTDLDKAARQERILQLLKLVGINSPEDRVNQYPHEFSGGMRQRIMIAIALSCEPEILIADEPTTALDVTIQAQILDLLVSLKKRCDMSIIFITHDLSVVAQVCQRVIVMYLGQVVETTDVCTLFDQPLHPYTQGLLQSVPSLSGARQEKLFVIPGTVPLLNQIPEGCRFAPRCLYATSLCKETMPELEQIADGHYVRCWRCKKERSQS